MKRFGLMALVTLATVVLSAGTASAQNTATGRWGRCRAAAWSGANDCYVSSAGYWGDVACGAALNFNLVACDAALAREVAF